MKIKLLKKSTFFIFILSFMLQLLQVAHAKVHEVKISLSDEGSGTYLIPFINDSNDAYESDPVNEKPITLSTFYVKSEAGEIITDVVSQADLVRLFIVSQALYQSMMFNYVSSKYDLIKAQTAAENKLTSLGKTLNGQSITSSVISGTTSALISCKVVGTAGGIAGAVATIWSGPFASLGAAGGAGIGCTGGAVLAIGEEVLNYVTNVKMDIDDQITIEEIGVQFGKDMLLDCSFCNAEQAYSTDYKTLSFKALTGEAVSSTEVVEYYLQHHADVVAAATSMTAFQAVDPDIPGFKDFLGSGFEGLATSIPTTTFLWGAVNNIYSDFQFVDKLNARTQEINELTEKIRDENISVFSDKYHVSVYDYFGQIESNTDPITDPKVYSFSNIKHSIISTATGEITGLISSSFDDPITGQVTFNIEGDSYSANIYEENGEYKFKKTIDRPNNGQSIELLYEPADAASITWFVYVYAKDGVVEDVEYPPYVFREYPDYSTYYVVGDHVRFKVRGVDSDSNLSHVIWSFDGPIKLLESNNRDDFEDGHEDTESMEIEITGDNGGNKFYLYATTYDDLGNSSEPLKWVLEARPNFSPTLTPIYPATPVVDLVNLGAHNFLIDVFDQDDNANDIFWYLDGVFVDTSGTGGGSPKTQEKGDIYFDGRGVYEVKAVVNDDDGNIAEYIWTVNAGTITDGNLPPVLTGEPYLDDDQPQYTIFRVNHNYKFYCTAEDADINLHKVAISLNGQLLHESVDSQFDDDRRSAYYDITFPTAGEYTISCFAIDAEEKTASSSRIITVLEADVYTGTAPILEIYPTNAAWTSSGSLFHYYGRLLDSDFDVKNILFYLNDALIHEREIYSGSSFDEYIQGADGIPSSGTHTLKIVAVDANGNKSNEIIKTIKPGYSGVSSPSIFKALPADSAPIRITQAAADDGLYLYVSASDPDNDLATIEWEMSGVGNVDNDLITPEYTDSRNIFGDSFGAHDNRFKPQNSGRIYARAKDDGGRLSSAVYWDIEIVADKANTPPEITNRNYVDGVVSIKSTAPQDRVAVEFDVFDRDGDLKSVVISINGVPVRTHNHIEENFVFNDECSLFTDGGACDRYNINFDYRGEQAVFEIVVEDYAGNVVTESFTVIQGPYGYTNHDPVVDASTNLILEQRTSQEFTLSITDEEGDIPSYTVDGLIDGHNVESITNTTLNYTPDSGFYGADSFVINWDDGFGGTAQTTVNVTVNQVILPPKLSITQLNIPHSESLINIGQYIADIVYSKGYSDSQLVLEINQISGAVTNDRNYLVGDEPIGVTVIDSGNVSVIRGVVKDPDGQSSAEIIIYIDAAVIVDETAPVVTAPASITITTNDEAGLATTHADIASFLSGATATDNKDTSVSISHNAPTTFAVGTTTVVFSATDAAGNTGTATSTITVNYVEPADETAPVVTAPAAITITTNDEAGLASTYADIVAFLSGANATDNKDTSVSISHNAPTTFAVGTTTVVFSATDAAGNTGTATSTITVNYVEPDTEAPVFDAILSITFEATSELTDIDLITPTFTDQYPEQVKVTVDNIGPYPLGETVITWMATDGSDNSSTVTQSIMVTDTTPPEFEVNLPIQTIDARGMLTDLAADITVLANDIVDGEVLATITDSLYSSGVHTVVLTAQDNSGNSSQAEMVVHINPLVELGRRGDVEAGGTYPISVTLSGPAAVYPVVIAYQIAGAVVGAEIEAYTGELVIEQGTEGVIELKVTETALADDVITLSLNSANHAVLSQANELVLSVFDINLSPMVNLSVEQDGILVSVIDAQGGVVTVTANINDINQQDTYSVTWNIGDSPLFDIAGDGLANTFEFEPSQLNAGTYGLAAEVTETSTSELFTVTVDTDLVITATMSELSSVSDSDNDGIVDADEGYGDDDQDGIADYLDDDSNVRRLPIGDNTQPMQTVNGLQLSIGDAVRSAYGITSSDASIKVVDITNYGGENGSAVDNAADVHFTSISNIISFNISNLSSVGDTAAVVIPLASAKVIPTNAVYRKYSQATGWYNFVVDDNNAVLSALKDTDGNCPPPLSTSYIAGLKVADNCIELLIEDGGPNDADGIANGIIKDPGVLAVETQNQLPEISLASSLVVDEENDVNIDASNTVDLDGDTLTYSWAQISGGAVELTGLETSVLSFVSPSVSSTVVLTFELIVNDGRDTAAATIEVSIANVNQIPTVSIGSHASSFNEGASVSLTSASSDPDDDGLTYLWEYVSGPLVAISDATGANVSFIAPEVSNDQTVELRLTVSDGSLSATAVTSFKVANVVATTPPPAKESSGGSTSWLLLIASIALISRKVNLKIAA